MAKEVLSEGEQILEKRPEERSGNIPNAAAQSNTCKVGVSSPSESTSDNNQPSKAVNIDKNLEIPNNQALQEIKPLKELKTELERRFVYAIAVIGLLPAKAAEIAGYSARETYQRTARDLIKKPKIIVALNKLSEGSKLPKWWLLKNLEEIIENPKVPVYKNGEVIGEKLDMGLKFKAMQEANKIAGLYAQEETKEFRPLISESELQDRIEKAAKVLNRQQISEK